MTKRALALVVSVVFALLIMLPVISTSAQSEVSFSMKNVDNVKSGDEFSVTVYLDSAQATDICAFNFSIVYDSDVLEYIHSSLRSNCFSGITQYESAGRISFAWESVNNATVIPGKIFTLNFKANSNLLDSTALTLSSGEIYAIVYSGGSISFKKVYAANSTAAVATVRYTAEISQTVIDLIEQISSLGAVEKTESCKNKLDELLAAYSALIYSQKQQVTNYQTLIDKYNEYLALPNSPADSEATDFLTKNKTVLALRASTVKVGDREAVQNALNAWEKLSVSAKLELTSQHLLLKNLSSAIEELDKEKQEAIKLQKLEADAVQKVANYKIEYGWILALSEEDITSEHRVALSTALTTLEELEFFNDLAYKKLVAEGVLQKVKSLYDFAVKLYDAENPADAQYIKAADDFRSKFSYILAMDAATLTYEDMSDVNLAYMVYSFLDEKTQSYLTNEMAALEALMKAGDNIGPEANTDEENIPETGAEVQSGVSTENEYEKINTSGEYNLEFSIRTMGKVIWILAALDILAVLLFIGVKIMFRRIRNKESIEGGATV